MLTNHDDPTVASAARWFWWIAGMSLVNTVLFYSGSTSSFVIGLAMTALASVVFQPLGAGIIILVLLGFYFAMGWLAQRGAQWPFYLGLGVYVIDALIYMGVGDWMSVGFHVFAMYCIGKGLLQLRALHAAPISANDPA